MIITLFLLAVILLTTVLAVRARLSQRQHDAIAGGALRYLEAVIQDEGERSATGSLAR